VTKKRILWIKTSPLHPLDRGGDLRTYHMLRVLSATHHVTFAGMVDNEVRRAGIARSGEYSSEAHWVDHLDHPKGSPAFLWGALVNAVFGSLPYSVERYRSQRLHDLVLQLLKGQSFDWVVCDFIFPAASLPMEAIRKSGAKMIVFQHNVESLIWKRRADNAKGVTAPYWRSQYRRMEKFERTACEQFDGVIAVSAKDAAIMRDEWRLPKVLGHVPTGVDAEYFKAVERTLPSPPRIVFLGSMDWHANADAVIWFANEAWPLIRPQHPDATFCIVGRQPLAEVLALQNESQGIHVTGSVPDVRPWLRSATAMVVPLRVGGGTRLKILEAMAAEVPVISTAVGAEGLPFTHNEEILLAETAAEFAGSVHILLSDSLKAQSLSRAASSAVERDHGWPRAAEQFTTLAEAATIRP